MQPNIFQVNIFFIINDINTSCHIYQIIIFLFILFRTYFVVAPRKIYPSQVIQVSVTILKLYHSHINVRASIRKEGEEYTSLYARFDRDSTRVVQMLVRKNSFLDVNKLSVCFRICSTSVVCNI